MNRFRSQISRIHYIINRLQNENTKNKEQRDKNSKTKEWIWRLVPIILTIGIVYVMYIQSKISEDSTYRQLRAYVVPTKPKLTFPPDSFYYHVGERIKMTYTVRNDGQTPAYDVQDSVFVRILPRSEKPTNIPDETRDFYYPIYGARTENIRKIHSGKNYVICPHHFVETDSMAFNAKKYTIFFWGRIDYTDAFKKPHFTKFCYEYVFDFPIAEFRTYGTCNQADRDEPYQPFDLF